jgi:septin family protein
MVVGKSQQWAYLGTCSDLLLGESGLGKSTLINTLFETKLYHTKQIPLPGQDRGKTVQIESNTAGQCASKAEVLFR